MKDGERRVLQQAALGIELDRADAYGGCWAYFIPEPRRGLTLVTVTRLADDGLIDTRPALAHDRCYVRLTDAGWMALSRVAA